MKKAEFIAEMQNRGWELDRWGHLQKDIKATSKTTGAVETRRLRCKIQTISVRVERQVIYAATQYTKEEKSWIRIESAYMKDIHLEDNKVVVGRYKFLPPQEVTA